MKQHMFGLSSETNLVGLHPALVKVLRRALVLSPYDFGISCGVRTMAQQIKEVEEGDSETLDSKHLLQKDGYGHAADVKVYVNGKLTWEHKYFRKVIQAIFTAAIEYHVQIRAGALWRDLLDSPHVEIDTEYKGES